MLSSCAFLTGTPVQNNIKDLYAVMCFLRVQPLDKQDWWRRIIERPVNAAAKGGNTDSAKGVLE